MCAHPPWRSALAAQRYVSQPPPLLVDPTVVAMPSRPMLDGAIIAQGPGTDVQNVSSGGLEFEHPEEVGDAYESQRCDECHDGMPIL